MVVLSKKTLLFGLAVCMTGAVSTAKAQNTNVPVPLASVSEEDKATADANAAADAKTPEIAIAAPNTNLPLVATAPGSPVTIPVGSDLRVVIGQGGRIKKVGQPVHAMLAAPFYVGEGIAVPAGTVVEGHIASLAPSPKGVRTARLLSGDFTPPRTPTLVMDALLLNDGTRVSMQATPSVGIGSVHVVKYTPKSQRESLRDKAKDAAEPYLGSHKGQRLGEVVLSSLPFHPNFIDQGTVYDAVLQAPVTFQAPSNAVAHPDQEPGQLHLRLASAISSNISEIGVPIKAFVTQPYLDAQHQLLYPIGSELTGVVTSVKQAGWLHKNGDLNFRFSTIQLTGESPKDLNATVDRFVGLRGQDLSVDSEGGIRANTSRIQQGLALTSLISPSRGLANSSDEKTALQRAGGGSGVVGLGLGQLSASSAIGFGYYGAAKSVYGAFIAKGSNVVLPANTPITLRMNDYEPAAVESASLKIRDNE